jgi:uncharacterized small protein (DUF1192 family)
MKVKSNAAFCVLNFIDGMLKYYDAMSQMIPKREALEEAVRQENAAKKKMDEVNEEVRILREKLAVLVAEYNKAKASKDAAEAKSK